MPMAETPTLRSNVPLFALTGVALSVGWGIRGNFGHEFGAMIPGALAAIALAVMSGREDWWHRVAYFAMFGALGWSFGGSISYMQVIAYTHSGHSPSVLYGFAGLFVIGFLWASLGGAGTALPAVLDRERLTELFAPISAVLLAWWIMEAFVEPFLHRQGFSLNWYDADWPGALAAVVAALGFAALRGRIDRATSLILHLALGWWIAFLLLVVTLHLRMTPPRGDNWAGCLGLLAGLLVYCRRHDLREITRAALVTGFLGGIGFAAASMLKLVEVTSGYDTNWHSILEQTTGLFNGLALAVALLPLVRNGPVLVDSPRTRRWTEVYAVAFVLILVTYLNLRKSPSTWINAKAAPAAMHGLPFSVWFNLAYGLLAIAVIVPLARHLRRPLALIPASPLGRAQWLFLVFLWWMVVGNFERALVGLTAQRLVTEGVIHVNAVCCTLLILLIPDAGRNFVPVEISRPHFRMRRFVLLGTLCAVLSIVADWAIVRSLYGDRFAGYAGRAIRFGPNATTAPKPGRM